MPNDSRQVSSGANDETRLIPLTKGQFAIVDAVDYEWLNQWRVCEVGMTQETYRDFPARCGDCSCIYPRNHKPECPIVRTLIPPQVASAGPVELLLADEDVR